MLPSPEKCVLMLQSPWWLKYPHLVGDGRVLELPGAITDRAWRVGWT
ncbi:hypothetical protein L542_5260 [Bordetella bronchiseptica F-1]|nr:hypothetical protein L542_5260 [Bordetella bronchiseptica F-1]